MAKDSLDTEAIKPPIRKVYNHQSAHRYEISSEWYKAMVRERKKVFCCLKPAGQ
jgi:hypothetical protein